MPKRPPQIVTLGGGGFLAEPAGSLLDDYILSLARVRRPRVCFIATATGDRTDFIDRFYMSFPPSRATSSHLSLFRMEHRREPFADSLLGQDIIYVGGGNTANMLAVWRVHGIDRLLRQAWRAGTILCGVSAGMICWFEDGVTDSYGRPLRGMGDGLGFLKGSAAPHYNGEADRRPIYHKLVRNGMPGGYAADDGCALHFVGRALKSVVASREGVGAYRVRVVRGKVEETAIPAKVLT